MVIILQQAIDNGKRFVSTVVEEQEGSCHSNTFSTSSQNSISERSAIYKQRIDSLFGRHTRMNKFNPSARPFCIRIQGESNNSSSSPTSHQKLMGSASRIVVPGKDTLQRILSSDEEDYQRIQNKTTSIIPDSLNNVSPKRNQISSCNNVSSVNITCGSEAEKLLTNTVCSLSDEVPGSSSTSGEIVESDTHMWKNRIYGGDATTIGEDKHYGLGRSSSAGGILRFPVEYLGSVPIEGTTTALQDLQSPLRALYVDFLTGKNVLSGQLAITTDGLRFEAPKVRLVNPFTTIAVWAAIKFVTRGDPFPTECAFMPLISDPEGQDKGRLFGKMGPDLVKVYMSCVNANGMAKKFRNPPIFACVMREASFSLDCHAFACKCAEDAIVVAANLYQSLVDKMRTVNKEGESGYGSLTRNSPATQSSPNEKRSSSSASSNISPIEGSGGGSSGNLSKSSGNKRDQRVIFSDTESVIPIRPPRRKKKHTLDGSNLKRYNSEDSVLLKMPQRRKSFKGNYHRPHYTHSKKRVQISTPDETSSDSVNESIDQVLDRIINPGGMSFNDLKPSYQELILKIALTLTQDQLYQKSKQAMKKHQAPSSGNKKNTKHSGHQSNSPFEHSQFLGSFLKSFSKISSGNRSNSNGNKRCLNSNLSGSSRAGILINGTRQSPSKQQISPKEILKKTGKDEEQYMSFCSGCMCERCSEKCYCSLPSKHSVKIVGLPSTPSSSSPSEVTKKGWSDKGKKICGYDTDSCAESEKCYCSLQRIRSNGLKIYNINLDTETSDTDTNSYDLEAFNQPESTNLSSTNTKNTSPAHSVEMLSYHPSKRSSTILSPPVQFQTTTSAVVHFDDNECNGSIPPAGNLNSPNRRKYSPSNSCFSNLHSEDGSSESPNAIKRKKVLLITGSSPTARVVYRDPYNLQERSTEYSDGKKSRIDTHRNLGDITEDEDYEEDETSNLIIEDEERENPLGPEKVLAMKKTAEIAAMFTDLKLDQTTNLIPDFRTENYETNQTANEDSNGSVDFETSLGYLP